MNDLLPGVSQEDIVFSCLPEDDTDISEETGGIIEQGVWKSFNGKGYNQISVDRFSCFLVAPFQVISNFTGKDIPYSLMQSTLEQMKKDGKFTPGVGGKFSDGMQYVQQAYNLAFGDTLKHKVVPLTIGTIIEALKSGCGMVTGIHYSSVTFRDEEDNAWIDSVGSIGTGGHCIAIVKANTNKDYLVKYEENYWGAKVNNIIGVDFGKFRNFFFNTGGYFYR